MRCQGLRLWFNLSPRLCAGHRRGSGKTGGAGCTLQGLLVGLAVIVPVGLWQLQLTMVAGLILVVAVLLLARLCVRQIGGYTGDYLGFSQQISEVLIYLSASGLWLST